MSFLRRVLARAAGRATLEGAPRHAFRREVDVSIPDAEVPASTPTASRSPGPASRKPTHMHAVDEVRPRTPASVPTVDTRTERVDQVERHTVREPQTTTVHVHVPAAVPPAKAVATPMPPKEPGRESEHHHHHHHHYEQTTRELRETHHEVTERVVVRTAAPEAAVPPPRRRVPTPRVERATAAPAPAAPPSVHVSIGRIVLSAAPAPAKPERGRPQAAPVRSLAEILAAKKGRA